MAKENKSFAIISTGGKQYKVHEGDRIDVELLDQEPGKKVTFSDVLLVSSNGDTKVGSPMVDGASVEGKLEEKFRGEKVIVTKKKRRKGYEKSTGHRQNYHAVTIEKITASGAKKATKAASAEKAEKKEEPKKAAPKKTAAKKPAAKKAAPKKAAPKKAAAKKETKAAAPKKKAPAKSTAKKSTKKAEKE